MQGDEEQIRDLVARWMEASKAGDVQGVLDLVTDDVVFLLPGRDPMRRDEFAAALQAQSQPPRPLVEGDSDIQEIQVLGDWAFMWTRLRVKVTPADGSRAIERNGHTLTVLRKDGGRWRLARDANLLGRPD